MLEAQSNQDRHDRAFRSSAAMKKIDIEKIITICSIRDGVQRITSFSKCICFHHHSKITHYTNKKLRNIT